MGRTKGSKNGNTQNDWLDRFADYDLNTQEMLLLALGTIHRNAKRNNEREAAKLQADMKQAGLPLGEK